MRNEKTGAVRELDILITDRWDDQRKILVECRSHKRKQDVTWIDELFGKASALGLRDVIAVSSSGFTKTAIDEANERGILALHLREAQELNWRKWRFGLDNFGVEVKFDPVVTAVQFKYPANFPNVDPSNYELEQAFLVDTRKKIRVPLRDWIVGFQKDPKVAAKLAERNENDAINHYIHTIPCEPGIGFMVEPDERVIPLVELVISVDSARAEYSVPLKHFEVGKERVHVGESQILGQDTKIVLHELEGKLKVMYEQRIEQLRQTDH